MSAYLCIEHGEQFIIQASSLQQAIEDASMWGAYVIRPLTPEEIRLSKPSKGEWCIKG